MKDEGQSGNELIGTVKWFNETKGFGFIESGGKDYFAHYKQILGDGFKCLQEKQRVKFSCGDSPKGPVANNIEIVK